MAIGFCFSVDWNHEACNDPKFSSFLAKSKFESISIQADMFKFEKGSWLYDSSGCVEAHTKHYQLVQKYIQDGSLNISHITEKITYYLSILESNNPTGWDNF
jgi:hypothetical protein